MTVSNYEENLNMMKLYDFELSGNCHKVRLMLSLLGVEYETIPVALLQGEQRSPEFLKLNPFAQVPVLVDGDVVIRDSQAILIYLARKYGGEDWLSTEAEAMAKVVQWLCFATNNIQNSLAAARIYFLFKGTADIESVQAKSRQTLKTLDEYLQNRNWLEGDRPTIADIACFPYIELAPDGKIELDPYPNVIAWLDRVKKLPGYVGISNK
jgi:glutathione S-transferase